MNSGEQRRIGERPQPAVWTLLRLMFGPIVWGMHLTVAYGVQSIACAVAPPPAPVLAGLDGVQLSIIAATVIALLLIRAWKRSGAGSESATPASRNLPENAEFMARATWLLDLLSVFGIVVLAATAVMLPTCAVLR